LAPVIPIAMQQKKVFIGLARLAVNAELHHPNCFAIIPSGPELTTAFMRGFFDAAMAQNPNADAEFSVAAAAGARENAKAAGLTVVYDRRYPAASTDLAPAVRAIV
jgi:branched-chain amino acid transport system substrate-binding protein